MSDASPFVSLQGARSWYRTWLFTKALPIWWNQGVDPGLGGFIEALCLDGQPRPAPRRARLPGRQAFAYATAGRLGWTGPWQDAARTAMDFAFAHLQRPDGLFRTRLCEQGRVLDSRAFVYDQAFCLLGMGALYRAGIKGRDYAQDALRTLEALDGLRHPAGGFLEAGDQPFQSNCHMHLLEAALYWVEGGETAFGPVADDVAQLAMTKFVVPRSDFVREFFDPAWHPAQTDAGRLIEPGHQFEWAVLMHRWGTLRARPDAIALAHHLFFAGRRGVDHRAIVLNALWDDLSVRDEMARLWPQTEYLKAAAVLGFKDEALAAANNLRRYLNTPTEGLWYDVLDPTGRFTPDVSPTSSLYHIMGAYEALEQYASI